jgi:hypothetical protein
MEPQKFSKRELKFLKLLYDNRDKECVPIVTIEEKFFKKHLKQKPRRADVVTKSGTRHLIIESTFVKQRTILKFVYKIRKKLQSYPKIIKIENIFSKLHRQEISGYVIKFEPF